MVLETLCPLQWHIHLRMDECLYTTHYSILLYKNHRLLRCGLRLLLDINPLYFSYKNTPYKPHTNYTINNITKSWMRFQNYIITQYNITIPTVWDGSIKSYIVVSVHSTLIVNNSCCSSNFGAHPFGNIQSVGVVLSPLI